MGDELGPALACAQIWVLWGQAPTPWVLDTPSEAPGAGNSPPWGSCYWSRTGMGEGWEKMQTTQLVSGPPRSWKWGCMGVIGDPGDRATQLNEHFAWRWEASATAARCGGWQVQRGIWKLKTTCASLGVLSWGLDLIGSQSCPISREVLPFLTWIRGSQCCARSQLGRGMLLGKQAAGRRV